MKSPRRPGIRNDARSSDPIGAHPPCSVLSLVSLIGTRREACRVGKRVRRFVCVPEIDLDRAEGKRPTVWRSLNYGLPSGFLAGGMCWEWTVTGGSTASA